MSDTLKLAKSLSSASINVSVTQLLAWAINEAKTFAKDEGQIIDTAVTHLAELVQAGQSWTTAYNTVKAEFDAAQTNEWQKIAFDALGELAAGVDQFNSILNGFIALLP